MLDFTSSIFLSLLNFLNTNILFFTGHSGEALELSKLQEKTKQSEYAMKVKEYEAHIEQSKIEQKKVEGDERRKTIQEETKQHQQREQYHDQLARKR